MGKFRQFLKSFILIICILTLCMEADAAYNDRYATKKAKVFLNEGKYLEALGLYQEIAGCSEDVNTRARAMFFVGMTYSLYLDQYDSALKQFEKIVKMYPKTTVAADAIFNSGMVLYEQGNYFKAHEQFKKYMEMYPAGARRQSAAVWADSSKSMMATTGINYPKTIGSRITDTVMRVLIRYDVE